MKVIVAFASKHGATRGIARFIGDKLHEKGLNVVVINVSQVKNLEGCEAVVLGSALYMGHWMKEAKQFVSRNRVELSARPVWLFSSGPTGKNRKDAKGRDILDPSVSGPVELDEIKKGLEVRDHRVFFGAYEEKDMGFFTRQLMKSKTIREAMPIGDFRDWDEIQSWVNNIANSLRVTEAVIK